MKIHVADLFNTLKEDGVTSQSNAVKAKDLKGAALEKTLQSLVDYIVKQGKAEQISQAEVTIEKEELSIRLEMNVINLPVRYVSPMEKVLDAESDQDVNVYMIVESPKVNKSGLRIDEIGTVDSVMADPAAALKQFTDFVTEKLADIAVADEPEPEK
ncbi:hypothetical protein [Secundilactobacillus malefermentans]|uniref:DUF2589 domain-containing protein n=1 Tax=Secundilactobacillus malefermentans TaxID=176292 RepID=A0A4R5NQC8_9LACO|nr:hypothetical protein [Secundilactobacillus malefermentans]KRM58796.1 hypothetical protein FD44_GL000323 [Secundilactobacillus malefermentans DSM 5705 = KCTC 3548]QEA31633.1 hypothetical protein FGL90_05240 [Secundilactobacillus malefermentans]TDG78944.1 hypothetical protein C5L31_000539 [Secundilactobacillus malefermentans]